MINVSKAPGGGHTTCPWLVIIPRRYSATGKRVYRRFAANPTPGSARKPATPPPATTAAWLHAYRPPGAHPTDLITPPTQLKWRLRARAGYSPATPRLLYTRYTNMAGTTRAMATDYRSITPP